MEAKVGEAGSWVPRSQRVGSPFLTLPADVTFATWAALSSRMLGRLFETRGFQRASRRHVDLAASELSNLSGQKAVDDEQIFWCDGTDWDIARLNDVETSGWLTSDGKERARDGKQEDGERCQPH